MPFVIVEAGTFAYANGTFRAGAHEVSDEQADEVREAAKGTTFVRIEDSVPDDTEIATRASDVQRKQFPKLLEPATKQQVIQAQAEKARVDKGRTDTGEPKPLTAEEFHAEVDTAVNPASYDEPKPSKERQEAKPKAKKEKEKPTAETQKDLDKTDAKPTQETSRPSGK